VKTQDAHPVRAAWLVVAGLLAFMLLIAGCGSSNDSSTGQELTKVGKGEGSLSLISWAGYVEPEWTKPFEEKTGCKVSDKIAGTSDEMVQLMRTGQYDGVSASGNASARLVEGGDVDPVNVSLVPNYKTIFSELKDQPYNTFDGVHYGIPHGRGANLLMWNTNDVKPAPTSWDVILDPKKAAKYKGKISAYDDPIYIADAAVYLKAHQPDLGIENPYELNEEQFEATVELLKEQRANVGEYWSEAAKQISAFANEDVEVGTTWQYQYFELTGAGKPVAASPASQGFLPKEGATGWSDTWMISSQAKHPNCMYMWMDWIVSPKINAEVAQFFGEAPAQSLACEHTAEKDFCSKYHAENPAFWKRVYFWETPVSDCGNGSEDCKNYNDWLNAWTAIKG
jgi:putative spermidine/putrescine transport system substrate-binding protein